MLALAAPLAFGQAPSATGQQDPAAVGQRDAGQQEPSWVGPPSADDSEEGPPPARDRPAAGDQDRPFMTRVGASVAWDSNFFRLPQAAQSERITSAYAGLRIDRLYAQQRFFLDVTQAAYRYQNSSYLDFDPLQYRGAWDWQLGRHLSGTLSADRAQSLVSYVDFRDISQRNVRTAENRLFQADGWLFGGWHLLGGLTRQEIRYSVPFPQEGSYDASGAEAGIKYLARSASSITLRLRAVDAAYTDRVLDPVALIDDGYRRDESEVVATWRVTGKSTLDARAAWIDYRSDHFAARDFSGPAGLLGFRWQVLAKLALNLSLSRDLQPWSESFASYRVDERLSLEAAWQIAARTALRMSVGKADSDYRNPVPGFTGAARRDVYRSAQLAAEWRLLRNLALNASVQQHRLASTDPAAEFDGTVTALGATLSF